MHNMHLYIDGLRIPIRNFYYHFTQYTDQRNKPVRACLKEIQTVIQKFKVLVYF